MSTDRIENPELEKGIVSLSADALTLKATDNETYTKAADLLLLHKDMARKIGEFFGPLKKAAHASWKNLCNAEEVELEKLAPVERHLKEQIAAYQAEQKRLRKAEEERLRKIALKEEEDRRLAEAAAAEEEGDHETAAAIVEAAFYVPPVVVPKVTPKVAGITTAKVWKWELVDINQVPREYLKLDEVKISGVVRALKGASNIAGIRVYEVDQIRAGKGAA